MAAAEPNKSDNQDERNVVPFKAKRKSNRAGLSTAAVTGLNLDAAGSAEVVEISKINVDPDYQRDLRWDLVNEIGLAYDIIKAGPILISERADGSLWCVDGQHRMAGAEQAGETEMFAHVVHGLTREQEAELRLARNNRKSDTQQEKFKTRLIMGDPKAHDLQAIVASFGTQINLVPNEKTGINAIATLEVLYDIDGNGGWLRRTLAFIRDITREGDTIDSNMASTSMLKAVTWFLAQHIDTRDVPRNEAVDRFSGHDYDDIRRKAVAHKAALGGALWVNTYRALVEIWNFRRTEARQLKWKTVGSIQRLGGSYTSPATERKQLEDLRERYEDTQR